VKDVREWAKPELRDSLGASEYHWLRAQALAASGDYAAAQAECEHMRVLARGGEPGQARQAIAMLLAEALLDAQPGRAAWPELRRYYTGRLDVFGQIAALAQGMQEEATVNVLRGLLALEEGDAAEAEVAFKLALDVWRNNTARVSGA